ncbi:MAG: hypothetical protein IJH04_02475 [Eggerthellaceae bacterium]|nr:hypothetical protein [Eggerthellaceae bacterium]
MGIIDGVYKRLALLLGRLGVDVGCDFLEYRPVDVLVNDVLVEVVDIKVELVL